MLGVVVSRADEASVHIGDQLRSLGTWTTHEDGERADGDGGGTFYRTDGVELREFDALHIDLDRPADAFGDPDLLAVASRHSGETGPLLSAHHTGNFGPAEFGGTPNELAMAAPGALAATLRSLDAHAPAGYDVGLECTHHGPSDVGAPSMFVEVGSAEPEWDDPAAAAAAAKAILDLRDVDSFVERAFVGFGGGHYAPRFTRIVRETDWAVGHIAADWGLEAAAELPEALLVQAFERSGTQLAVVDGDRTGLVERIEALGYRTVGESWLRETAGVPLELVERLEADLSGIDAGLRFGAPARADETGAGHEIVDTAPGLLADANGIDAERVRAAVDEHALAYETVEGGSRVAGRIAVPAAAAWDRVEAALVDLLRERFDRVAVHDDEIVVRERAFDPDRARELGVEPGPAFGRLADGQSVTVDGAEVRPEAVHETRTRRYPR